MPISHVLGMAGAALRLALPFARRRWEWRRAAPTLDRMGSMDELRRYLAWFRPEPFMTYQQERAEPSRAACEKMFARCGVSLAARRVLDIGPGLGEGVDLAHEQGALRVEFIEIDPYFFTLNRLKGATGYRFNHNLFLAHLADRQFDVIVARGSLVVDYFAEAGALGRWCLRRWLATVDTITAPGGVVLIVPFWSYEWVDDHLESKAAASNPVVLEFRRAGYKALDNPDEALPFAYPVVFEKRKDEGLPAKGKGGS